jgi:hypothetical protein
MHTEFLINFYSNSAPSPLTPRAILWTIASKFKKEEDILKATNILRIGALVILGASLMSWASRLSAADPTGDSPANAIPISTSTFEICTSFTLAPGASIWIQVPYHAGKDVEIYAKNAPGVNFDVYDPQQIGGFPTLPNPTGRLTPNPDELNYTKSWRGHLGTGATSGFLYVLITNTNATPITFSLCTIENGQFFPPPMNLPETITTSTVSIIRTCDGPIHEQAAGTTTTIITICP